MNSHNVFAKRLADNAVIALKIEADLTPKPGLVDKLSRGAHHDMDLQLMHRSAQALWQTFYQIALYSYQKPVSQQLREEIAFIGREGEIAMLETTKGINTHKGAIWALGLLISAMAVNANNIEKISDAALLQCCGEIARYEDSRYTAADLGKGAVLRKKHTIHSALDEARLAYPTVREQGLVIYEKYQDQHNEQRLLNTLVALMSVVDDTCILSRGGIAAMRSIQQQAQEIIAFGGVTSEQGQQAYSALCQYCLDNQLSPGGSADLLAMIILLKM